MMITSEPKANEFYLSVIGENEVESRPAVRFSLLNCEATIKVRDLPFSPLTTDILKLEV